MGDLIHWKQAVGEGLVISPKAAQAPDKWPISRPNQTPVKSRGLAYDFSKKIKNLDVVEIKDEAPNKWAI